MSAVDPLVYFPATAAALSAGPVVVGHRGMGRTGPGNRWVENTRAGFAAAYAAGARWVELDVLPSAEGDLMLVHDSFHAGVPVWQTPTSVLLAAGFEPLEGLEHDLPVGLGLDVEIKTVPGDADGHAGPALVAPVLDWIWMNTADRPVLVSSFAPHVVATVHTSGVPAGWLGTEGHALFEVVTHAISAGLQAVVVYSPTALEHAPVEQVSYGLALAADHGVTVWGWDVTSERVGDLLDLGVGGVVVDDVPAAVAVLPGAGLPGAGTGLAAA